MMDMPELDLENVFDGEFRYEYKGVGFGGWRNGENDWGMCSDDGWFTTELPSKEDAMAWAREFVDVPRH